MRDGCNRKNSTGSGMAQLAPLMPLLASIILVFLYVPLNDGLKSHHWAVAAALIVALSAWVALGWLVGPSDVRRAHAGVYLGLVAAVVDLDDLLSRCKFSIGTQADSSMLERLETETTELKLVLEMLAESKAPDAAGPLAAGFIALPNWRSGAGYTELSRRIHAIGSRALLICPLDDLRESARSDYFRLLNSRLPDRDTLFYHLKQAALQLGNDPETFFDRPRTLETAPTAKVPRFEITEPDIREARYRILAVRMTIGEYRDSKFDGITRERTRTIWTIFAASGAAYVALALSVMAHASADRVTTAMILFLIGALVGLMDRLAVVGDPVSEVEDYGLSNVRLLQTITLSGLAAVLGVVIVVVGAALAGNLDIFSAQNAGSLRPALPDLDSLFDIQTDPFAVAIAAVFGFAPRLLLSRLESSAARLKLDLKSSAKGGDGNAERRQ